MGKQQFERQSGRLSCAGSSNGSGGTTLKPENMTRNSGAALAAFRSHALAQVGGHTTSRRVSRWVSPIIYMSPRDLPRPNMSRPRGALPRHPWGPAASAAASRRTTFCGISSSPVTAVSPEGQSRTTSFSSPRSLNLDLGKEKARRCVRGTSTGLLAQRQGPLDLETRVIGAEFWRLPDRLTRDALQSMFSRHRGLDS